MWLLVEITGGHDGLRTSVTNLGWISISKFLTKKYWFMFIMLYGTSEQFITLTLRNGWAGRKANMGMGWDEILSEIATFKYQVQFLAFEFSLNFLTWSQKMMIGFYSYTNKQQKGICWINLKEPLKYTQKHTFKYILTSTIKTKKQKIKPFSIDLFLKYTYMVFLGKIRVTNSTV